jgi:hypothetical protein
VEEIPYEETRNYVKRVLSWKRKLEFLERARREIRQLTRKNAKATTSVAAR